MFPVAVDDDPGKSVGLAPDQSIDRILEPEILTMLESAFETPHEKVVIEFLLSSRDAACHDLGRGIVDRGAEGAILEILQRNDVARFGIPEGLLDFTGVDPVVTVIDSGAGSDDDSGHDFEFTKAD